MSEVWKLDQEQWKRDPASGRFSVHLFRGLGPPSARQNPVDLALLVGARVAGSASTEALEFFPAEFSHSPRTGRPLPSAAAVGDERWIPPYGGGDLTAIEFSGLRRTSRPLRVSPDLTAESRPDRYLPLPRAGDFHFAVGRFNLAANSLLAIEFSRGLLFAWLPGVQRWAELEAHGRPLPECSLPREAWGLRMGAGTDAGMVFLPTDQGLARVDVDLIALEYRVTMAPGRCIGAPTSLAGLVAVPISDEDGGLSVMSVSEMDIARAERLALTMPAGSSGKQIFQLPLADRTRAIWLSGDGMVTYRPSAAGTPDHRSFTKWPADVTAEFQFGCPYLSSTGRLWQLCWNQRSNGFEYVRIGPQESEVQPANIPRSCTGKITYHLETLVRSDPWLDPDVVDAHVDEIVLPILETVGNDIDSTVVVCLRAPYVGSLKNFFSTRTAHTTSVNLAGEREVRLHTVRLTQPWLAAIFVFDGHLYFYHPAVADGIPGWRLAAR